jgi:hypothetical protein
MTQDATTISVTRDVHAGAHEVFTLLRTPRRHVEFDGSEMLRGSDHDGVLDGVGAEFLMRMYYEQFGDYVMKNVIVEYEPDRRIAWEPERYDVVDDEHWHHRWGFELSPAGADRTHVTEFYDCSRSPEHAREIVKNGTVWLAAMERTLERLEAALATLDPT